MPTVLETVTETRDQAQLAYDAYIEPLFRENRDLTEEEETRVRELTASIARAEARITEISTALENSRVVEEIRSSIGASAASARISNINEPRTYGEGSPNSYYADICRTSPYVAYMSSRDAAVERLASHAREVAGEMRDPNSAEGKRALRTIANRARGENNEAAVRLEVERAMHFGEQGLETRDGMSTGSTSGGSFVTPQYFVAQYAPFREFGRPFADAANKMPLPEYGMTIYLPAVNTAAGVSSQIGENQGIDEQDPNAGYLSTGLTTLAGQVTVSQQLLDRAGPDFSFDVMVFDQLQRAYAPQVDILLLTTALANAGTVAVTNPNILIQNGQYGTILGSIAKAKAQMVDANGVKFPATHVFFQPVNWEWATVQTNSQSNPLVVPSYAGPYNAAAAGSDGDPVVEGDTGYRVLGLRAFEDGSIPLASSNNQAIVAYMPEVWYWEGTPVTRTVPQTQAQNLSVLLQEYNYVASIVRYQQAVQALTGLTTAPSF